MINTTKKTREVLQGQWVHPIRRAAILGTPGCGKSTVLEAMKALEDTQSTKDAVRKNAATAHIALNGTTVELVELPGVSMQSTAVNLQVAQLACRDNHDLVLNILDATSLSRSLVLTLALLHLDYPTVALLNKIDILEEDGFSADAYGLSLALGIPVIPLVALNAESVRRAVMDIEGIHASRARAVSEPAWGRAPTSAGIGSQIAAICAQVIRKKSVLA